MPPGIIATGVFRGVFRIFSGYLLRAAAVAGPLAAPYVARWIGFASSDSSRDKAAGAIFSLLALTVVLIVDLVDHGIPRFRAAQFRGQYLTDIVEKHFAQSRGHLRFNVMMLRRDWRMLWLLKTFQWDANYGFDDGSHLDNQLRFLWFQGVCGRARRKRAAVFCDLRCEPKAKPSWAFWNNPYYLFPPQMRKTSEVLAIFSVPLMVQLGTGGNRHFSRPLGVLNVDAVSPEGAEWLAQNWEKMKKELVKSARFLAVSG